MGEFRGFLKETLMVLALILSVVYSAFLIPYIFFINRGNIVLWWVGIYVLIVLGYIIWWLIDKGVFEK